MKNALTLIFAAFLSLASFAAETTSLFVAGKTAPGIENSTLRDVTADATGNTYVTGTVLAQGYNEIFIAKYDAAGTLQWVKAASGGGHYGNNSYGIALDAAGNAYITGTFSGSAIFNNKKLTAPGTANMFVAKYDAAGNLQWIQQANGNGYENQVTGNDISINQAGELVVTGQVVNMADFGGRSLSGTGNYAATYTANGEMVDVKMVQ